MTTYGESRSRSRESSAVRSLVAVVVAAALALTVGAGSASAAASGQLTRYPYLSDAVDGYMMVNWATDRSSADAGSVRWGRVAANGSCSPTTAKTATRSSISVNGVPQYQWRAQLGLSAGAQYCYRVFRGTTDLLGSDTSPRFWTQVPVGSTSAYKFAVLGDWGATDATGANPPQAAVLSSLADSGARFAVTTGDQGYPNGDQKNFGDLHQVGAGISGVFGPDFWKKPGASIPLFTTTGNHGITNNTSLVTFPQTRAVATSRGKYAMETYCCVNGTFSQSQQSAWYAFNAGAARFYVLKAAWSNSNLGTAPGSNTSERSYANDYAAHWEPGDPQYEWLKADLAANSSKAVKFAFFHNPLYSVQDDERSDPYLQGDSPRLEGLLAQHGVDIAFNGHAHLYERNTTSAQGLRTYVTGGGGADIQSFSTTSCPSFVAYAIGWSDSRNVGTACGSAARPSSKAAVYHYLLVTVDGTSVTVTPTNSLGQTFDVQTYDLSSTSGGGGDTQKPSAPTGLSASNVSSSQVDLSWTASTDDVGVTGYDVLRGGTVIATVGSTTSYRDTTVAAGTSYSYTVRARDAAGNVSDDSNTVTVVTPAAPPTSGSASFSAVADSRVSQASPTSNYGSATTLSVDQDAAAQLESYLKFDVAGVPAGSRVTSATLRLTTNPGDANSATTNGPEVYSVADTTWTETGITWNSRPARAATLTADSAALAAGQTVEFDVTALVTGNGVRSFGVIPDSADGTSFLSGEHTATGSRPELVLTWTS